MSRASGIAVMLAILTCGLVIAAVRVSCDWL